MQWQQRLCTCSLAPGRPEPTKHRKPRTCFFLTQFLAPAADLPGLAEGLEFGSGPVSPAPSFGTRSSLHKRTGSKGSIPYLSQALDHLTSTIGFGRFQRILGSGSESPDRNSILQRNGGADEDLMSMPASPFDLPSPEPSARLMRSSWERSPPPSNGLPGSPPPHGANGHAPGSLGNGTPQPCR